MTGISQEEIMAQTEWKFCDWDGRPALYSPTHAHACIDGATWRPFDPAVVTDAKVMTKDAFEAEFQRLPPYPVFPGSTEAQEGSARPKAAA